MPPTCKNQNQKGNQNPDTYTALLCPVQLSPLFAGVDSRVLTNFFVWPTADSCFFVFAGAQGQAMGGFMEGLKVSGRVAGQGHGKGGRVQGVNEEFCRVKGKGSEGPGVSTECVGLQPERGSHLSGK